MASALPQDENQGSLEISEKNATVREMYREKVAEKRELDVNLIKLRQCLITPFPTGAFTRLQNNQIWEIILDYVTTPLDIDSAQRTCPTFQDILFGKISKATPGERQVSAVLKIMKKGVYLESMRISYGVSSLKRVPWRLRRVSKSWQRAMDQAFLTEFEGEWPLELNDGVWWNEGFTITRHENLDRAWSILENSSCRSSLLQIIRLDGDCINEEEMDILYPKILEFLDKYGEHVKGLILDWTGSPISWTSKYLDLLSLVLRMPNLKAFTIDVRDFYGWKSQVDEVMDTEELIDFMFRHPLPPLLSMEVLSIMGRLSWLSTEPLALIFSEILSKSCNLKSVGMDDFILENKSVRRAMEGRQIEFINCYDNLSEKTWLSLSQFPLRKIVLPLSITINQDGHEKSCSESKFFGSVNLFGNTLECLQMPVISSDFKEGPVPLQLPKLRKLILPLCEGLTNFDFLIPFSGLEHLEFSFGNCFWDCCKNSEDDPFCSLQIKKFDELEKSDLWTFFPKLRIVRVFGIGECSQLHDEDKLKGLPRRSVPLAPVHRLVGVGATRGLFGTRACWYKSIEPNFRYVRKGEEITKELELKTTPHLSLRQSVN